MQEINHDGSRGPIVPFDSEKLIKSLGRSEVKEVRVFKLDVGQRVTIEGEVYEVRSIKSRGRVQLKHVGEAMGG